MLDCYIHLFTCLSEVVHACPKFSIIKRDLLRMLLEVDDEVENSARWYSPQNPVGLCFKKPFN